MTGMTAHHQPDRTRAVADTQKRWEDDPPITISLPRGDAWLLLTTAQLRHRDPGVDWHLSQHLERVGRTIQQAVCDPSDPALHALAEAGWNPSVDLALASGDRSQPTTRYAFLIENSDNGTTWMQDLGMVEDSAAGAGVEQVHDANAQDYARRVLARRFAQLHDDDSTDWDDLWYRVCVWDIARAADYHWASAPRDEPSTPGVVGSWLQANGCAPHAVEVRTPSQVHHEIPRSRPQPSPATQ